MVLRSPINLLVKLRGNWENYSSQQSKIMKKKEMKVLYMLLFSTNLMELQEKEEATNQILVILLSISYWLWLMESIHQRIFLLLVWQIGKIWSIKLYWDQGVLKFILKSFYLKKMVGNRSSIFISRNVNKTMFYVKMSILLT